MRNLPPALQSHLDGGETTLCNCWKVTRSDGQIQGFTDHDQPVTFADVTYEAEAGFIGTESLSSIGLSVDNTEIHSALSSGKLNENDLANGLYDNAEVEIYIVNWQSPEDQHFILKSGNIGEVRRGELTFMAEVRGLAHHLQQPQGRLFQSTCDVELGVNRCGVNLDDQAYRVTATVSAISADGIVKTIGLSTFPSNWFRGGKLEWLTGPNAGAIGEVKSHQRLVDQTSEISFWAKFSEHPETGDQFRITAGCDKRFATCRDKFSNQLNFRGFPHIPGNDFLISTPSLTDGAKDGTSQNQ